MSAIAKLQATKQPPLPLKAEHRFQDYPTVRIVHKLTAAANGGTAELRKQDVPFCPDPSDKERLIVTLHSFVKACDDNRLKLKDAARHDRAKEVLGLDLQERWELMVAAAGAAVQDADFVKNTRTFLMAFLPPNAFNIQKKYLDQASKPFNMDCYTACSRLRTLNNISVYLPGSNGRKLFDDDASFKGAFYNLMLPEWQLRFDATGNTTDDPAYTIERLTTFMEQQRLHYDAAMESRRRQQNNGGRGRGGHSSGYSNQRRFGSNHRFQPYNNGGRGNNNRGTPRSSGSGYSNGSSNRNNNRNFGPGNNNQGRNQQYPRHTRSRGPAPPPVHTNVNRETRGLYAFQGQESEQPQANNDMYYQENPGEHNQDQGYENADGFFGESADSYATNDQYTQYDGFAYDNTQDSYDYNNDPNNQNFNDGFAADQFDQYESYDAYDQY